MSDWYDCIELKVRPLVRLLRDNGFNTVSSCGHDMSVDMEWYGDEERLSNLLLESGYSSFTIHVCANCVDGHWTGAMVLSMQHV